MWVLIQFQYKCRRITTYLLGREVRRGTAPTMRMSSHLLEHSVTFILMSFPRSLWVSFSLCSIRTDLEYIQLTCFLNQNMPSIELCGEPMRDKGSTRIASRGTVRTFYATSRVQTTVSGSVPNIPALLVFATGKM